jgi:hypothetical protein
MLSDSVYTSLNPTPQEGSPLVSDTSDPALELVVQASETIYIEAVGLTASNGECRLWTDPRYDQYGNLIDQGVFYSFDILGLVGPYVNDDSLNVCGALITLASNVLTSRDDPDLELNLGDLSETAAFILTYPIDQWTTKAQLMVDSLYSTVEEEGSHTLETFGSS